MRSLFRSASACVLLGTGFAVSACTPPNQVDSDLKVATAGSSLSTSTARTPALPGYVDCIGSPTPQPKAISLRCVDDSIRLVDISWDSWTSTKATGRGTVMTGTGADATATPDASVELTDPFVSPAGLAFTRIKVDGNMMQP